MLKKFNIRIYGLLIRQGKVLLIDEVVKGRRITKFPGGGLELGEGPIDCLVREFREEAGIDVKVEEHIYTTDFFQPSAFKPEDQIISIYYRVAPVVPLEQEDFEIPFDQHRSHEEITGFRWIALQDIKPEHVTLPIDRYLVEHVMHAD
ncbi:MAG: NUDIX domain-containing protein, partial [Gammaproteobacteria bacterium]|nr:NUDIX domain-containing protein [Gammaproteobacteria bacterium]